MKKLCLAILIVLLAFTLSACRGGDVTHTEILEQPSEIYTDSDINAAIQTIKDYFAQNLDGCKLTEIGYIGDDSASSFAMWAERFQTDEAIILCSSFDVDPSADNVILEPNATYDWEWILVREKGGKWMHVDHGYG